MKDPTMTDTLFGTKIGNFVRPDLAGKDTLLYGIALGQPILMVHGPAEGAKAQTAQIQAAAATLPEDGTLMLVLSGEPGLIRQVAGVYPGATTLVDADSAVHQYLTQAADQPLAFTLLDRMLRISASGPVEPCAVEAAVKAATALPYQHPPVLTLPSILTPPECKRLIDHFQVQGAAPSPSHVYRDGDVSLEPDPAQKTRMDHLVDNASLSSHLMQVFAARLLPEVQLAFNFTPKGAERFKIVAYGAKDGGHFAAHRDNVTPDASNRRFAVTLNLNTGAYEGGGLLFPEYDQAPVAPPAGGAVVFSCSLAHRVMPVTTGTRYALITFLTV